MEAKLLRRKLLGKLSRKPSWTQIYFYGSFHEKIRGSKFGSYHRSFYGIFFASTEAFVEVLVN